MSTPTPLDPWANPGQTADVTPPESAETPPATEPTETPPATPPAPPPEPPPRVVDYRALAEERAKRRELQNELERLRQNQPAPEAQFPDPQTDPAGYLAARTQYLENQVYQIQARQQAEMMAARQAQSRSATAAAIATSLPADAKSAASYLVDMRSRQLSAMGVVDPSQKNAILESELVQLSQIAEAEGKTTAQKALELAMVSGYKPAAPTTTAADKIQAGLAVSREPATSPAVSGGMKPEDLLNIKDPEEFSKAFDKLLGEG